jgi:hypothetical protein
LTVYLGTFNTNIANASPFAQAPLPDDYKGSLSDQMMETIKRGKFVADGDKDKAAMAIFEVVVGEGVGAGREDEQFLLLDREVIRRAGSIRDQFAHALDVFADIAGNVYVEQEK